ncbi:hypothetical protein [Neobacillus bataviensis]|uniref:hypothetical protein n=1 Tax=Neobacillus bataviensis TaxID=220685 RepID=UPI001CBE855D|nr:hypothetical protein [Neobacillus bataviensis]
MKPGQQPSKKRYAVAGLLLLLGLVLCLVSLFSLLSGKKDDKQLTIPGNKSLVFEEKGTYTIFFEYQTVIDGKKVESDKDPSGVDVSIKEKSADQSVKLESYNGSSYSLNGHKGISVYRFQIDHPGTYEISAGYTGTEKPEMVLTVKKEFMKYILFIVLGFLAGSFLGVIAIILFIWTYYKRLKFNQQNRSMTIDS